MKQQDNFDYLAVFLYKKNLFLSKDTFMLS